MVPGTQEELSECELFLVIGGGRLLPSSLETVVSIEV